MGLVDKILLTVYSFIVGVICVLVAVVIIGWEYPFVWLHTTLKTTEGLLTVLVFLLVMLIVSIRFLIVGFTRKSIPNTLVTDGEMGQIRITLDALVNLVKRISYQVSGVRDVSPKIVPSEGGIDILVKAKVACDNCIPNVIADMQNRIKEYIVATAGINVKSVKVLITDVLTSELKTSKVD